jgi:hypothetical protein
MINYELKEEVIDNVIPTQYVEKTDGSGTKWQIPIDESNSDYKEYLNWLKENE